MQAANQRNRARAVRAAAASRGHAGAAPILQQKKKPRSFDPTNPFQWVAHFMRHGMDKQIRYERERDLTYVMQGGAGGKKMKWEDAHRLAKQAYQAGGEHHLRKLRSNKP